MTHGLNYGKDALLALWEINWEGYQVLFSDKAVYVIRALGKLLILSL